MSEAMHIPRPSAPVRALRATATALRAFVAELNRRKVVKVGIVYLLLAFALMEVAANFFPALHVPEWAETMVAALLILGFPMAIGLTWAFELTPEGIRRELPAPGAAKPAAPVSPPPPEWPTPRREDDRLWSVVVLPFADLSPDRDQGFFVEGIAEEIRYALSRIDGLNVVARSSSLAFRNTSLDVREIGQRLGVSAVLEGSLRKWKSRVVVNTSLVSVADGFEIWSGNYDGTCDDILAVQGEIAGAILAALGPALPTGGPVMRGHTRDPDAHRAVLKGRYLLARDGHDDLLEATRHFRQAIQKDSHYAAAQVGLSDARSLMVRRGFVRPRHAMDEAKAAAVRALEIEPRLSAAHKALGVVLHRFDWDPAAAERAFRTAVQLNPGYAGARYRLGEFLVLSGRSGEAIEMLELAQDLDPISTIGNEHLVLAYYLSGQHDRADRQAAGALELHPRDPAVHRVLGQLHLWRGRHDAALGSLRNARQLDPDDPETLSALAIASFAAGQADGVRDLSARLGRMQERRWAAVYSEAALAAAVGERERAFDALDTCADERVFDLVRINVDPAFDRLRTEPVFQKLLERLGVTCPASPPGVLRVMATEIGSAVELLYANAGQLLPPAVVAGADRDVTR
jgi:TolB-like protein/Flp pilus assembly protein TadD